MSAIVFEDLEENVLHNIIKSASIKINKKADESRILTKEGIVKMSNTITDLHNSFNKILAFNSNIAKIHQIEAARVEDMGKEDLMERGGQLSPPSIPMSSASNSELTQLVPTLTKTVADLAKELKDLNLISPQADAIPSMPLNEGGMGMSADVDAPDRRRSRTRSRFGGMGLAGKALGVVGVGMDIFDRAGSGQSAGQIATGVAGGVGGGVLGAKAGAALGALGGPAAPITVPLGALVGGALGYFGGSAAGDAAYEAVTKPESTPQRKGEQAREQKQRSNKLFSAFTKNIAGTAALPIGGAMVASTAAYNLSDKFASYLGGTMSTIGNYVSSIPERLANLGSNIWDAGQAAYDYVGDVADIISSGGGAADMEKAIENAGITDATTKAQIMAQTAHESMNFTRTTEMGNRRYFQRYEGRRDLGNTRPGDGYKYRGRGFIQITGRANYEELSRALGVDFVNNPDLVAQPEYAAAASMVWLRKRWNRLDGKWNDTRAVTRVINGGYNGLADRQAKFRKYTALYGSGQTVSSSLAGSVRAGRQVAENVVEAGREMLTGAGRFIFPIAAVRITSNFGPRRPPARGASSSHKGIDFGPRRPGTQGDAIFAASDGVVTKAGVGTGYGNVIYIDHDGGYQTRYAHLRGFTVRQGMRVQKGQQIGQLGNTGIGSGPHLHFEIRRNGQALNPLTLLGSATVRPDNTATEPSNEQVQPVQRVDSPARSEVAAQAQEGAIRRRSDGRRGFGGVGATAPQPRVPAVAGASPGRAPRQPPANPRTWYQWILGG
jgi:putative chitinase